MTKLKVGDYVDYHSIIGGEITSHNHKITALEPIPSSNVLPLAWLTNKRGAVSPNALTLIQTGYVYSFDVETYHEDMVEILHQLFDAGIKHGEPYTITRASKLIPQHSDFVTSDDIVKLFQRIADNASDYAGEYAEDYLIEPEPQEIKSILSDILNFIESNYDAPSFWQPVNIHDFHIKADFSKIKPETFEAIT